MKLFIYLSLVLTPLFSAKASIGTSQIPPSSEKIIGKWISEEKNLIVEVYKNKAEYKAKVLWFSDNDDVTKPYYSRADINNPDDALKSRKILGMEVLRQLNYNKENNTWENGLIYDADSGREWSAYTYFKGDGKLVVKGYWHFKFISKSVLFNAIDDDSVKHYCGLSYSRKK